MNKPILTIKNAVLVAEGIRSTEHFKSIEWRVWYPDVYDPDSREDDDLLGRCRVNWEGCAHWNFCGYYHACRGDISAIADISKKIVEASLKDYETDELV
jgi:hypothetical protein